MFKEIMEKTGKSEEELTEEFEKFKYDFDIATKNKFKGEELTKKSFSFFKQIVRVKFLSGLNSSASEVAMYIMGITGLNDRLSYKRGEIIKNYKLAPTKIVFDGKVNEYKMVEGKIKKISVDPDTKERSEIFVDALPDGAECIKEDLYVAPKDVEKTKWGRENRNYGKELPAHEYTREVYGIAEIDEDVRYFRLTLRGNKATGKLPVIGKTYSVKVLDITKEDEISTYLFKDSPTYTNWNTEIEWNPFDGEPILDGAIGKILFDHVMKLGELRGLAEREDTIKENNKKRVACGERPDYSCLNYNACLFVEADILSINIEPASTNLSSRLMVSDESCGFEFNEDSEGAITCWLSDAVTVDFGEYSRVVLCCYPKLGKARDDGKLRPLQIDVYGAIAYEESKTDYNPEKISVI